jgi:hypothetical protein
MKKTVLRIATVLLLGFQLSTAMAQAPQKMSYQAVVRNSSNALVTSVPVGMQISILQGSASGTAVYVETQTATTNANGLVTIEIGNGTPVIGTFSSINWAAGPYFIMTETDPTGGTAYSISGTTQLMSVPYALYAATSGNGAGAIGATGVTGANGTNGTDGINGTNGLDGTNGVDGTNGTNGTNGFDGIAGSTGATGSMGPMGMPGTNGTNGSTGAAGLAGTNGTNGTNGSTGATGLAGANGTNGTNGSTGATGLAGANGTNGATGVTGSAGTNGTNGINGSTGATGLAGANGINGTNGSLGATGATGIAGSNGTNGTNGSTGATGAVGSTGLAGTNGTNGAVGATGAANINGTANYIVKFTGATSGGDSRIIDNGTSIGIGTATPNASAALDITSTTGAFLLPRMTTAQRDALTATPGMVIYNSTTGTIQGYHAPVFVVVDQVQTSYTTGATACGVSFAQSFVPAVSGNLTSISVLHDGGGGTNANLIIRAGSGTGGAILSTTPITTYSGLGGPEIEYTINPVSVVNGLTYTFEFSSPSACTFGVRSSNSNVYGSGALYVNGTMQAGDLYFKSKVSTVGSLTWWNL